MAYLNAAMFNASPEPGPAQCASQPVQPQCQQQAKDQQNTPGVHGRQASSTRGTRLVSNERLMRDVFGVQREVLVNVLPPEDLGSPCGDLKGLLEEPMGAAADIELATIVSNEGLHGAAAPMHASDRPMQHASSAARRHTVGVTYISNPSRRVSYSGNRRKSCSAMSNDADETMSGVTVQQWNWTVTSSNAPGGGTHGSTPGMLQDVRTSVGAPQLL